MYGIKLILDVKHETAAVSHPTGDIGKGMQSNTT